MNRSGSIPAQDLLQRLAPAVRPIAPRRAGDAPALFETKPFDELLEQAFRGEIHSDRPVEPACDLQPPLRQEQLRRLADAADRAEASGAQRALMMLDGRGFVLDVTARAITAEMQPDDAQTMLRVDTAMVVPAEDADAGSAPRALAGLHTQNLGLARLLQSLDSAAHGRDVVR